MLRVLTGLLVAGLALATGRAQTVWQQWGSAGRVDPALAGTWESMVPGPQGVARWVWVIGQDDRFSFRAEGPGAPAPARPVIVDVNAADRRWGALGEAEFRAEFERRVHGTVGAVLAAARAHLAVGSSATR